ncbi:MAG: GumC family protein [Bacteroidota bacterium]
MTLVQFLRIIAGRIRFIVIVPLLPAVIVFLLTMNDTKEYKSSTLIYTGLASTPDALESSNARIDNYAVNNSFDNLLNLISSREILERTGLKLLSVHLLQTEPKQGVIGEDLFKQLQKITDPEFRNRMIAGNNADTTFARLWREHTSPSVRMYTDNDKLPYCPEYIEGNLKMKRAGISDMLEMSYASYDAASTQLTLKILTGIFMTEFKSLKSQDAQNLVKFFSQETETAETRLNAIAAELKEYRIANGIINYDEQTKQLTVEEMYMNGELREELRKYAASEASLADLNQKLGNRSERIANNQTIVDLREELAKASSELLTLQSVDEHSPRIDMLQKKVNELKLQMKNSLTKYSALEHTEEGTNIALLEQQWISQYIATVEGKVRIDVFKERRSEFRGRFNKFAPLGSSLHKYERDIDVAEKEYLELLHSLNMARLRQQNLEASTTIKVLDEPILPLKAEPAKRSLLLIGAWLISAFLSIVIITALELLDRNIRTPERAVLFSDLPVLAAYPDLASVTADEAGQNAFSLIKHQILRNFKLELLNAPNTGTPKIIAVASILNDEGKSTVAAELAQLLTAQGNSVLILTPDELLPENNNALHYEVPNNFSTITACHELTEINDGLGKDFIIIELPSFQGNEIPVHLLRRSALILFVMRADRIWRRSDSAVLKYITFPEGPKIHSVVNGVHLERIEEFVGELPTARSSFRSFIKRMAEFRFQTSRGKA